MACRAMPYLERSAPLVFTSWLIRILATEPLIKPRAVTSVYPVQMEVSDALSLTDSDKPTLTFNRSII